MSSAYYDLFGEEGTLFVLKLNILDKTGKSAMLCNSCADATHPLYIPEELKAIGVSSVQNIKANLSLKGNISDSNAFVLFSSTADTPGVGKVDLKKGSFYDETLDHNILIYKKLNRAIITPAYITSYEFVDFGSGLASIGTSTVITTSGGSGTGATFKISESLPVPKYATGGCIGVTSACGRSIFVKPITEATDAERINPSNIPLFNKGANYAVGDIITLDIPEGNLEFYAEYKRSVYVGGSNIYLASAVNPNQLLIGCDGGVIKKCYGGRGANRTSGDGGTPVDTLYKGSPYAVTNVQSNSRLPVSYRTITPYYTWNRGCPCSGTESPTSSFAAKSEEILEQKTQSNGTFGIYQPVPIGTESPTSAGTYLPASTLVGTYILPQSDFTYKYDSQDTRTYSATPQLGQTAPNGLAMNCAFPFDYFTYRKPTIKVLDVETQTLSLIGTFFYDLELTFTCTVTVEEISTPGQIFTLRMIQGKFTITPEISTLTVGSE